MIHFPSARTRSTNLCPFGTSLSAAQGGNSAQAKACSFHLNSVSLFQSVSISTASFRMVATAALANPRRPASRAAQLFSAENRCVRLIKAVAASNNMLRMALSPHLEMRPDQSISPDWYHRGVRPRKAPTSPTRRNRAGSSTSATKLYDTMDPTPGMVINRRATGCFSAFSFTARSRSAAASQRAAWARMNPSAMARKTGSRSPAAASWSRKTCRWPPFPIPVKRIPKVLRVPRMWPSRSLRRLNSCVRALTKQRSPSDSSRRTWTGVNHPVRASCARLSASAASDLLGRADRLSYALRASIHRDGSPSRSRPR